MLISSAVNRAVTSWPVRGSGGGRAAHGWPRGCQTGTGAPVCFVAPQNQFFVKLTSSIAMLPLADVCQMMISIFDVEDVVLNVIERWA